MYTAQNDAISINNDGPGPGPSFLLTAPIQSRLSKNDRPGPRPVVFVKFYFLFFTYQRVVCAMHYRQTRWFTPKLASLIANHYK